MGVITKNNKSELSLMLFHLVIGAIIFIVPFASNLISLLVTVLTFIYIFSAQDKVRAILISSAYIATSDVFFRMTGGLIFYELHKYLLIVYAFIGIIFDFSKTKGYIYLLFIGMLMISVIITDYNLTDNVRKMVAFNLSGPVSLGFFAFYTYRKRISMQSLGKVMFYAVLPIISLVTYLILYNPSIKDKVTGTGSNFATSGGFGPNQVATILGVGIFIFITRLILKKPKGIQYFVEVALLCIIVFRGLVTFSRGGIVAAAGAILFFIAMIYLKGNRAFRRKMTLSLVTFVVLGLGVWLFAVNRTSGLIENRYTNRNAAGIEKEDVTTGRKDLVLIEFQAFLENPIFGLGVGKNLGYRLEKTGTLAATHNEISRMLAEHGAIGIFAMFILIFTPLVLRLEKRNSIYFYSFFLLWILTINHSAMRIAFPSFIYGLSVLDVYFEPSKPKKELPQKVKK